MAGDQLSTTFAALADPTRRAILSRLTSGEASVTELAEPFDMSLPAVTKHLKVLQRAGFISQSREAQWRPCRLRGKTHARSGGVDGAVPASTGSSASTGSTTTCANPPASLLASSQEEMNSTNRTEMP